MREHVRTMEVTVLSNLMNQINTTFQRRLEWLRKWDLNLDSNTQFIQKHLSTSRKKRVASGKWIAKSSYLQTLMTIWTGIENRTAYRSKISLKTTRQYFSSSTSVISTQTIPKTSQSMRTSKSNKFGISIKKKDNWKCHIILQRLL